jgi:ubiquinone/menaquinone biosynthesis C-methylase UbiE
MITTLRVAILLTLLGAASGCSQLARTDVGRVLTSGRDGWQHPEQVIESLNLAPGDRVAEIGAGDGYWLPWLSEAVGPAGLVYAVEVDDAKIAVLQEKVTSEDLGNVVVVLGAYEDPKLPDGTIDLAMTCLTYHHIEARELYFQRLRTDLSPRGRVAHLDDRHDVPRPLKWLQSSGHWSDPEAIRTEMGEAGYQPAASFDFLPLQSFQVFVPEPASAHAQRDAQAALP